MQILKSFVIAFSVYSKIPCPQLEWKEEDMKYMLCFFPWIGAVIGGCVWLWDWLCDILGIGKICRVLTGVLIPLVITGGFHLDGFMDTMDAFHSYQPRQRKLEILKDSHIGAFSVIMLAVYGLIYIGAFSEIMDKPLLNIVCGGFFLSRCLCGISVVSFPLTKKDGTLGIVSENAKKPVVKLILYLQTAACIGFMLYHSASVGMIAALSAFLAFWYDYDRTKKEIGGITGDTAGWFVLVCEACMVVAVAAADVFMHKGA